MKKLTAVLLGLCLSGLVFPQNISDINGFDRVLMYPYSKPLDYAGTVIEGLSLLTPGFLWQVSSGEYCSIGVQYAEALALAYGVKEFSKYSVSRPRPYMYFPGAPEKKIADGDWDDSFISGHATLSFTAAGFTSYLYSRKYPDSPYKTLVTAGSFALAATTACLRIASGNHFASDVLCGALAGTTIGVSIPFVNEKWVHPVIPKAAPFALYVFPTYFSLRVQL